MLPNQKITFAEYSIDILVLKNLPAYSKRRELLRPLRILPDGQVGVLYQEKVYPLYLDSESNFSVLLSGAVFEAKNTNLPLSLPVSTELRFIEAPLRFKFASKLNWNIERNQFGVYIYISATDEIVEHLVAILVERNKFNVLSWGENIDPLWRHEFSWSIRLSAGLSIDSVRNTLVQLIESETFIELLNEPNLELEVIQSKAEIAQQQKQAKSLMRSIDSLKKEKVTKIAHKDEELEMLYAELEILSERLKLLTEENKLLAANKNKHTSFKEVRRGAADRLLANALHTCFPALAFSPDVVDQLKSRFEGSSAIWNTFEKLNSRSEISLEKLSGLAGKAGWLELRKHINTGTDNRGRVYCRRSKNQHNFDVIVHWKKNDKDQEQIFKKLANYQPFESTNTVFM